MVYTSRGNFEATGQQYLGYFKNQCGLLPHHRVLEVGSGIGRMAIPLTQYLSAKGSYDGLEIVDVGVRWCQEKITPHYPNFRFQWADVYNQGYNPGGKYAPEQFVFPYPSNSFDFVFLTSVFTHMMRREVENYLYEIVRVMKPQGRCLITYFLQDRETTGLVAKGKSTYPFANYGKNCYIANPALPEDVVGFDRSYVEELYPRYNLEIENVYTGEWSGRPSSLVNQCHQDMILARKTSSAGVAGALQHFGKRQYWRARKTLRRLRRGKQAIGYGLISQVVEEARQSENRKES
jgi:SAM-dependent methyltransferase